MTQARLNRVTAHKGQTTDPGRKHWRGLAVVWLVISLTCLAAPSMATAADPAARVVYHADFSDPRRFSAMLTSINNMAVHYENELMDHDIRIVAVSHGVRFLTDDPLEGSPFAEDDTLAAERDNLRGRLSSLVSVHGVKVELCDITRSALDLPEDALYDGVSMVPSGVVRLAELQNTKGFAYIKIE
jgi:intracellular sulfur oxidation DsrE/DsrF family protein